MQTEQIADQVRLAFAGRDLELLGPLLHPAVRWGEGSVPRACRSRADVLVTFARLLDDGINGEVIDLHTCPTGIVAHLRVTWPQPHSPEARTDLWQSYLVQDGLITEIRGHEDQATALDAVS